MGEPVEESTNWGMYVSIVIFIIAALSLFAYFFVEFEDVDDSQQIPKTILDDEVVEDPYAWAKVSEEVPEWAKNIDEKSTDSDEVTGELTRFEEHPGWLWDETNEEWVSDPNFNEENV